MINNYQDIVNSIIDNVTKAVDISDYEKDMIKDGLLLPKTELPSSKIGATNMLGKITKSISDYNYIMNKLRITRFEILTQYRPSYDHKFTVLTRQGRPSKECIVAEMHYTSVEMASQRNEMEYIDTILDFFSLQVSILEKLYRTVDSRQYAM